MTEENKDSMMFRSTLTGLFCGIIATLLSLVFDMVFRSITKFPLSGLINVSSIIIACTVFLLLFGGAFNLLQYLKGGKVIFSVLFLVLTCVSIWSIMGLHLDDNPIMNVQYRYLLSGIVLIMGICTFFLIPFLYTNKWVAEHVI